MRRKATKKGPHVGGISSQALKRQDGHHVLAIHSNVSSLLSDMEILNAPADQVEANWMARGYVQSLEITGRMMVLFVHSLKPMTQKTFRYWTKNPNLQLQLFTAYLCGFVVDIFSMAPEGPTLLSLKDGGEILTIQVDQDKGAIP